TRIFAVLFISGLVSCDDFLDVGPPKTEIVSETVYSSDGTAIAAIRGIYINMSTGSFANGGSGSVTALAGLSSDELMEYAQHLDRTEFNLNDLSPTNGDIERLWAEAYKNIYLANSVLEGLSVSD